MAIIEKEPEAARFIQRMQTAKRRLMAAPTKLELLMVAIGRKRELGKRLAELILMQNDVEIIDWTNVHAVIAAEAFVRYGKGRHPAALNYGDCMAYAVAKSLDAPLLFKGDDFAQTDIWSADKV